MTKQAKEFDDLKAMIISPTDKVKELQRKAQSPAQSATHTKNLDHPALKVAKHTLSNPPGAPSHAMSPIQPTHILSNRPPAPTNLVEMKKIDVLLFEASRSVLRALTGVREPPLTTNQLLQPSPRSSRPSVSSH